jgi:putative tryptophan/tyrosine transport system substrate-binding protein
VWPAARDALRARRRIDLPSALWHDGGAMRSCALPRRVCLLARCAILTIAFAISFVIGPPADAQTTAKKAQVGVLGITPSVPVNHEMFKQGLAQLGYTDGQEVTFVQTHADGEPARLAAVAAELVRSKPDVIFARGPAAVAAAIRATAVIPIVAIDMESDPLALGYVKTLARPGGHVTGVFLDLPELSAKQLQLIREILPGLSRVALVGDSVGNAAQYRATERAAQTFKVQVLTFEGRTTAELDAALEAARRSRVGAVVIFSSPTVYYNVPRIAALASEKRLPIVALFAEFAEAGGLLAYGPNLRESFRRCGVYVGKILNGTKPADLPIERPEKFELVINVRTAKALGLTIPQSLLQRADQIIE